jgi:outer membrane lipoprotein-sorting protein
MVRAVLLGVVVLSAGCPKVQAPVARPYPPPTTEELVTSLRDRARKITSLHADTRVEHLERGERVKLSVEMLLARGGQLRFEAQAPLQGSVATLVADGRVFALLDARHNRFLTGPAKGCNVARLLRLELEPEEIVTALTGGVPLVGEPSGVSWDSSEGGREVLELRTPDGGRERVWLDGRDRRWDVLKAERTDAAGRVLWTLANEEFEDRDGVRLPRRTHLAHPPVKAEVHVKRKEIDVNPTPPPGVFHLDPPPGIAVEQVDC